MGCSPFGRLISMAFGGSGKRPARKRSRHGRHREYSPQPPPQHVTSQSMLRTVVYRDDAPIVVGQPVHTIHPPATVQMPDGQQLHRPLPEADISPSPHVHAAAEHDQTGAEAVMYAVAGDVGYQPQVPGPHMAAGTGAVGYRYAPSPVPSAAWGDQHGERRREYFGGEYRYSYPTPMREGIYRMATDANRLTTMFSDENPNACSIT
ncbi:hypothetical protein Taro_018993 [Colocasia esculenta]|uniref:Uncharacterized protein n=1 Tax=Colocasia esculenta TaxID=4460 RepID=A0A843US81_COLES|nr:hypothetical protein [Colocasia esculenta]